MNANAKKAALVAGVCLTAIVAGTPQAFAVSVDTYQTAQQARTVTGTVVDESGIPIIGANILEKGTTNGVITDIDGNFSLNVSGFIHRICKSRNYHRKPVCFTDYAERRF